MSKSKTNLLTKGYFGKTGGQYVLRRVHGQSVIAALPTASNNPATPAQLGVRRRFREAAQFATRILADPQYKALYEAHALNGQSAYNRAIQDYFCEPWIESIDVNFYTGKPGEAIRVMANDDFMITKVLVTLKDAGGNQLESGLCKAATETSGWIYTTTTEQGALAGITIEAVAYDLPGHFVQGNLTL